MSHARDMLPDAFCLDFLRVFQAHLVSPSPIPSAKVPILLSVFKSQFPAYLTQHAELAWPSDRCNRLGFT
jgi:hypothetical protein